MYNINDNFNINDVITEFDLDYTEHLKIDRAAFFKKNKKAMLLNVLKKTNNYSVLAGVIIFTIFLFKKFGITISYLKSVIIVATTGAAIATGTVTGGYIGTKKIIEYINKPEQKIEEKKPAEVIVPEKSSTINKIETKKPEKSKAKINPKECIAIIAQKENLSYAKILYKYLKQKIGSDKAIFVFPDTKIKPVGKIIKIEQSKIGDVTYLFAQVTDLETLKYKKDGDSFANEKELEALCEKIINNLVEAEKNASPKI